MLIVFGITKNTVKRDHILKIFNIGRDATARKILAVTFMTFDPLIIGHVTMGMRTKITFTAWREV